MKPVLTACMLLVALFPAGAATMQSERFREKDSRILRTQQTAPARLLVTGYLYAGPSAKNLPADTSSSARASANPGPSPAPQENAARVPLPGSSARAQ
jgi:hypothetical protein